MAYTIEFRRSATRELENLPRTHQENIRRRIDRLAHEPRPPGASLLVSTKRYWRLRVGDYRVIYDVMDRDRLIIIVRIGIRGDVYRNL